MEILLFAIVGIIVAVVSAATKKPQKKDGEQPPVVRPRLSDIQRALMLEFDNEEQSAEQPPFSPQPHAPQAENAHTYHEGMPSTEGYSSWERTQPEPATVQTYSPWAGQRPVRTVKTPARQKPLAGAVPSQYTNVDLHRMDEAREDEQAEKLKVIRQSAPSGLNLQFGKNELISAVVYSEILARKY